MRDSNVSGFNFAPHHHHHWETHRPIHHVPILHPYATVQKASKWSSHIRNRRSQSERRVECCQQQQHQDRRQTTFLPSSADPKINGRLEWLNRHRIDQTGGPKFTVRGRHATHQDEHAFAGPWLWGDAAAAAVWARSNAIVGQVRIGEGLLYNRLL